MTQTNTLDNILSGTTQTIAGVLGALLGMSPFTTVEENFNSPESPNVNNGQINLSATDGLFKQQDFIPTKPLQFSSEAVAVFDASRELWKYYHIQPNWNLNHGDMEVAATMGLSYNPNASLYDIREYFQERNVAGKMNNKSSDENLENILYEVKHSILL